MSKEKDPQSDPEKDYLKGKIHKAKERMGDAFYIDEVLWVAGDIESIPETPNKTKEAVSIIKEFEKISCETAEDEANAVLDGKVSDEILKRLIALEKFVNSFHYTAGSLTLAIFAAQYILKKRGDLDEIRKDVLEKNKKAEEEQMVIIKVRQVEEAKRQKIMEADPRYQSLKRREDYLKKAKEDVLRYLEEGLKELNEKGGILKKGNENFVLKNTIALMGEKLAKLPKVDTDSLELDAERRTVDMDMIHMYISDISNSTKEGVKKFIEGFR